MVFPKIIIYSTLRWPNWLKFGWMVTLGDVNKSEFFSSTSTNFRPQKFNFKFLKLILMGDGLNFAIRSQIDRCSNWIIFFSIGKPVKNQPNNAVFAIFDTVAPLQKICKKYTLCVLKVIIHDIYFFQFCSTEKTGRNWASKTCI